MKLRHLTNSLANLRWAKGFHHVHLQEDSREYSAQNSYGEQVTMAMNI